MKVNGVTIALPAPASLTDFLRAQGYDVSRVAVLLDGQIVPRAQFEVRMLTDDAVLEIVRFVGGG